MLALLFNRDYSPRTVVGKSLHLTNMRYNTIDSYLEVPLFFEKPDNLQPVMEVIDRQSQQASPLQKIVQKARFLIAADDHLRTLLPREFAMQCKVMNYHEGTLVLQVSSAAIATRLQFQSRDLLEKIRVVKRFERVRMLRFKVQSR